MKNIYIYFALAITTFILCACTPAEINTTNAVANDTVNFAEFACIEATALTDAPAVATVCGFVKTVSDASPALLAFIDKLIARREALKAAGYSYDKQGAIWKK